MANSFEWALARVRRELETQDAAWGRVLSGLAALGDASLSIPAELLEAIEQATAPLSRAHSAGVRA